MKKFLFLAILILGIFFVNCATEQKAIQPASIPQEKCDAPVWNVGDTWRYRYSNMKEWQYTVEGIEKEFYIVDDLYASHKKCFNKKTLELVAYIDPTGKKEKLREPVTNIIDFPIYVGKKWKKMVTYRGHGFDINYLNEFKVISYEDVTVPVGTFKAFKIEMKQTNFLSNTSGKTYFWYSPEVKFIAKYEYEDIAYWRGTRNFGLIKFELKDKQLPTPELKLPPLKVDTTPKPQTPLPEKPKISVPATLPPGTNIVVVTGTSANIRSGAGNEFSVLATVKQGDKLILLGEHGEWLNVRLEDGREGWISNKFIKY